ncbi:LOW QUALITY PROTEIN: hypothetical protein ACJ73_03851, partial [Blastomyces percursus]
MRCIAHSPFGSVSGKVVQHLSKGWVYELQAQIEKLISEVKSGVENEFVSKSLTKVIKKVGEKGFRFFVGEKTAFYAGNKDSYPLQHSTLLDSGSTEYVCNEISRFLNFQAASPGDFLLAGDSKVPILGYGDVDISLQTRRGTRIMRLFDVAYCEGFATNLISLRKLQRLGYWWDTRSRFNSLRKESNDEVVAYIQEHHGQYTVEYIPSDQKQMRQ